MITLHRRSAFRAGAGLLVFLPLASSPFAIQSTDRQDVPAVHPPQVAEVSAPVVDPARGEAIHGEKIDPSAFGPAVIETMATVMERQRALPPEDGAVRRLRNGAQGTWVVPSRGANSFPHSGEHYVFNKWGDTRMAIGFGGSVDLAGAWFAGQADRGAWAPALRAIGFRGGEEVARTEWFEDVDGVPSWFAMDLADVDRVVIEARAALGGAGWYGMDDLAFTPAATAEDSAPARVVLDFEDLDYRANLTGSGYAGLTWETGTGEFEDRLESVHAPKAPESLDGLPLDRGDGGGTIEAVAGGSGTAPVLLDEFAGTRMNETGTFIIPPDTHGTAGLDHFVEIVNSNLSIWEEGTQTRVVNTTLGNFWNSGFVGDPRVVWDEDSDRFFMVATDFNTRVYIAASMTSDPTGAWFKTFVNVSQGVDANRWPDYPTLGVDANGVYTASFMVGGPGHSIFAIDKAPLVAPAPSLGTVTAFRNLNFHGAIQPCVTYGDPGGGFLVSRSNTGAVRVRQVQPPMTNPTLVGFGGTPVANTNVPPNAQALGSNTNIDTGDHRLQNAVYRNGSIWTTHTINQGGRAAVRWYEIDPNGPTALQTGTVNDPSLHYYYPAIAVNALGQVVLGFSGSDSSTWVNCYFTGRLATDPLNEMAPPVKFRDGAGPYNHVDGSGRNRWGDYSFTSVDPSDDLTFWTVQEYARTNNRWGTRIAQLEFGQACQGSTLAYCSTAPNSAGAGSLIGSSGTVSVAANNFTLEATDAPATKPGQFYYGPVQVQTPFGDGFRCVGAGGVGTFRINPIQMTDGNGDVSQQVDFTLPPANAGASQITPGSTWNFQFWFRDPQGPGGSGFNLSDGLSTTFCP